MTNGDYIMEQLLGNRVQNKNRREYDWGSWLEDNYYDPYCYVQKPTFQTTFLLNQISESINEKRNDSNMRMPEIKNYTYNEKIGLTTIEWCDGTKTTARAENPECADRFTGFMTAYAKKAAGNTNRINDLFDAWVIEKPKKEAELKAKKERIIAENKAKEERDRMKREKHLIRREAIRIKREYEAKKLAHEKYNIPMDEE